MVVNVTSVGLMAGWSDLNLADILKPFIHPLLHCVLACPGEVHLLGFFQSPFQFFFDLGLSFAKDIFEDLLTGFWVGSGSVSSFPTAVFPLDTLNSPITSIPGIGKRMGAMILAEIGDFSKYESADKILAYAGMSPSIYQSGQLTNCYSHMEKRGSRYLRYALFNAAKYVCIWDPTFAAYLAKKRAEGKHYNIAISHAAKKLARVIYALQKTGQPYRRAV